LLLGINHQSAEEGIYLSESASFETPLGDLIVDQKLNRKLASCSTLIRVNDIPHLSEHSLEVLLPMVKYCFPEASIVPILMCSGRPVLISSLARALRIVMEKYIDECLVIISSNVSQHPDPALAFSMADEFRSILEQMDTRAFLACLSAGRISACGKALAGVILESGLLEGSVFSSLLPLAQGREENGETVYYGAFATSAENDRERTA
jgi:AmmeMemoRadiSam system protein B